MDRQMSAQERQAADNRAKKFTFTNALKLNKLGLDATATNERFAGTEYRVTFSINIQLNPGEELGVAGDLPALGLWQDFSLMPMIRQNGNQYISAKPFVTDRFYFQYKYVIVNKNKELIRYEHGVNRIADLECLITSENSARASMSDYDMEYSTLYKEASIVNGKKVKNLRLEDELETFEVKFRVHIPEFHPNAEMKVMMKDTIIKDKTRNYLEGDGYRMFIAPQAYNWLKNKYGQPVKPWERTMKLTNDKNNSAGQFYIDDTDRHLWYQYIYTNG